MSNQSHEAKYGVPFCQKSKIIVPLDDEQIERLELWRSIVDDKMINTPASSRYKKAIWLDESQKTTKKINQYKNK